MKESVLVTKILKELRTYKNSFAYKNVTATGYSVVGIPDITACINGQFIGIEVKVKTNKATKVQLVIGSQIIDAKGLFWVVRSMKELKENLDNIHAEKKPKELENEDSDEFRLEIDEFDEFDEFEDKEEE
jgi:hypothetical protein